MGRKTPAHKASLASLETESTRNTNNSGQEITLPPLSPTTSPLPIELGRRESSFSERLVPVPLSSLALPELDSTRPLPSVHINKANLVELKHACDDAVKSVSPSAIEILKVTF
jgi:hypothetical protein